MVNMDLNIIRNRLEATEETIIFRILDRAQYKQNIAQNAIFKSVVLHTNPQLKNINLTDEIKEDYETFLNILCESGDDNENEIEILTEMNLITLNAISRRIHFGSLYVAESKFQENPKSFTEAVLANNKEKVLELLVNRQAEEKVLTRVFEKCKKIQSAYSSSFRRIIQPKIIREFYKNTIIPLTVEGELQYFFKRIKNETN